jgi:hypothetical protein
VNEINLNPYKSPYESAHPQASLYSFWRRLLRYGSITFIFGIMVATGGVAYLLSLPSDRGRGDYFYETAIEITVLILSGIAALTASCGLIVSAISLLAVLIYAIARDRS